MSSDTDDCSGRDDDPKLDVTSGREDDSRVNELICPVVVLEPETALLTGGTPLDVPSPKLE